MSGSPNPPSRSGPIRAPQNLAGGLLLIAIAALALWLAQDLSQGTLRAMGPAMLPDWLAIGVGFCGLLLAGSAFAKPGDAMEKWSARGPVFISLAIIAFAITIRPFSFGSLSIPGLGLVVAGPLAILIGGYATPDARPRELVILALSLSAFCMLLFGDALSLPIPIFPQSLAGLFPDGWSQKAILRATASAMIVLAIIVFFVGRSRPSRRIDVATHSEGI